MLAFVLTCKKNISLLEAGNSDCENASELCANNQQTTAQLNFNMDFYLHENIGLLAAGTTECENASELCFSAEQ